MLLDIVENEINPRINKKDFKEWLGNNRGLKLSKYPIVDYLNWIIKDNNLTACFLYVPDHNYIKFMDSEGATTINPPLWVHDPLDFLG